MISGLCLVIILSFLILKVIYSHQNLSLESTWQSEETGQVLTFLSNGNVELNGNLPIGIYHIISPNKMEYTIEGHTFITIYEIKNKKLYWGIDEASLEAYKWLRN